MNRIHKASILLEFLIAVSIMCFIATICIGSFSFLEKMHIRSDLELLYMSCKFLQQQALVTQQEQIMVIDAHNKTFSYGNERHKFSSYVEFGAPAYAQGPPSAPIHAIHNPITFPDNKIIFYPNGTIQAGSLYLTNKAKSCLYALSSPVSAISYLRKYRYDGKWHLLNA